MDCSTLSPHLVPTDRSVGKLVDIIIFLMHRHLDVYDDNWIVTGMMLLMLVMTMMLMIVLMTDDECSIHAGARGPQRTPVSLINCYLTIHGIHCTIETTIHSSSQYTIVTIVMHCLRMLFTWSYCPLQLKMQ